MTQKQVCELIPAMQRVIHAQEQFYKNITECPGQDKCEEGKVRAFIKEKGKDEGSSWSFICPVISWGCAYGRKQAEIMRRHIRDRTMPDMKVPRVHLDTILAPRMSEAVRAVRSWDGKNWLILIGETRTGKSYSAAWYIYNLLSERSLGKEDRPDRWKYELEQVERGIGWGLAYEIQNVEEVRNMALTKSLFVLDDLAVEDRKAVGVIGYILAKRWDAKLPTIITTNLGLQDIKTHYGRRIYERIVDATRGNVKILSEGSYREYENGRDDYE